MFELLLGGASVASSFLAGRKAKKEAKKAERENRRRIKQITDIFSTEMKKYSPTGEYGKALFEESKAAKASTVGASTQQLLRSGVGGVNVADVGAAYERQTGQTNRLKIQDFLTSKRTNLNLGLADALSQVNTIGPSSKDITEAYAGMAPGIETLLRGYKDWKSKKKGSDSSSVLDPGGEM